MVQLHKLSDCECECHRRQQKRRSLRCLFMASSPQFKIVFPLFSVGLTLNEVLSDNEKEGY